MGGSQKAWRALSIRKGGSITQPDISALEMAIAAARDSPDARNDPHVAAQMRMHLAASMVLVLGHRAGDMASDVLHVTEPIHEEQVIVPVFTRIEFILEAVLRNAEWQLLDVLELNGGALLATLDADVAIVLNPLTLLELELPPGDSAIGC